MLSVQAADFVVTKEIVEREFLTEKSCVPNCIISCVHQVSNIDPRRARQHTPIMPGGAHRNSGNHYGESSIVQTQ